MKIVTTIMQAINLKDEMIDLSDQETDRKPQVVGNQEFNGFQASSVRDTTHNLQNAATTKNSTEHQEYDVKCEVVGRVAGKDEADLEGFGSEAELEDEAPWWMCSGGGGGGGGGAGGGGGGREGGPEHHATVKQSKLHLYSVLDCWPNVN
ncbi:myosin heavy chain IB-like [Cydia pomonella]|uniref:myosin heavy chain IB-like n=1 Tax=Cydia pomonella TaxID=82600 RepID=UPI002ADD5DFE|nr:myosin heavy chain IB-like [Cydia pomonella]